MSTPYIRWRFYLTNKRENLPFQEIRDTLGIEPTEQRKLEECKVPQLAVSGWMYAVTRENARSAEDLFQEMRAVLEPKAEEILALVKKYELRIQFVCVIDAISGDGPAVCFGPDTIAFIHRLGAELDFDLYYGEE